MSIASEVSRISQNVQNTISVIQQTGVPVPENPTSDNLPSLAETLANEKQDKLTGTQGQVVGFNSSGEAEAVDPPSSLPEGGSEGKLLGYGTEPEWVDSPVMNVGIYDSAVSQKVICTHTPKEIVEAHQAGKIINVYYDVAAQYQESAGDGNPYQVYAMGMFVELLLQADSEGTDYYNVLLAITGSDATITYSGSQTGDGQALWSKQDNGSKTIIAKGYRISASAWSSDSTYADLGFNYRASVAVSSVTTSYIPDINFSPADQYSGNLASFADTYNGGVYIYAKTKPTETVKIQSAIFTRS